MLHRNDERDVLVVVIAGGGTLRVDGRQIELHAQRGVMIPKGTAREICAGPQGLRYLSIHLRRSGLSPDSAMIETAASWAVGSRA